MGKIRVHELRKEIKDKTNKDVENRELIAKLNELGISAKSHSSSIEQEDANKVLESYVGKKASNSNNNKNKNNTNSNNKNAKSNNNKPKNKDTKQEPKQEAKQEVKQEVETKQEAKQPKQEAKQEAKSEPKKSKKGKKVEVEVEEDDIKIIQLEKTIMVKELAELLDTTGSDLIMRLMKRGLMTTLTQDIDFELASSICEEFDVLTEEAPEVDILQEAFKEDENIIADEERPPVVVVMGHVDHGKTSLLDSIRASSVTEKEAGGITQHIGAYTVAVNKKPITFLDTPGHEAFTAMRMRGASVTDIAILVVAADDGVMPQTIEAINHAKAAGVEIIIAINKMDKEGANPERVKQELTEYELITEDWGGDTICVPVSAVTKEGIDNLLEMIILVAELKELRTTSKKRARGAVIEARLDKGRGPVATVLVQSGTLKVGDPVVAGSSYGKVRAMINDKGQKVKNAGPSMPVEILGLSVAPSAGDSFYVAKNDKQARQLAESIIAKDREDMIRATPQKVSLDDLFTQIKSGNMKELNIVIKADVQGSVEAVRTSLEKLSNEEVRIRTIHGGVGAITESDVMLASASNAIIIGFNVRPENMAKSIAEEQKVDVRLYRVIYNAIEDINSAMKGLLDPIYEEKVTGHAEIRQIFKASGVGTIGGSYILDGKIVRGSKVRIIRDGTVVYEGELSALKRFKDDVKEVNAGYECGLLFEKFNDLKENDRVEAYVMEEVPR